MFNCIALLYTHGFGPQPCRQCHIEPGSSQLLFSVSWVQIVSPLDSCSCRHRSTSFPAAVAHYAPFIFSQFSDCQDFFMWFFVLTIWPTIKQKWRKYKKKKKVKLKKTTTTTLQLKLTLPSFPPRCLSLLAIDFRVQTARHDDHEYRFTPNTVLTSYWADVWLIGLLWSLASQRRNTTARRWFPLSPHHFV